MKITKYVHACLLVEMPAPLNRTALFDPGSMSEAALDVDKLEFLDDIIVTHSHGDHMSLPLIKKLVDKFPNVHITAPSDVVAQLAEEAISATSGPSDGIVLFDSPHEDVRPLFPIPEEIGVHYLDKLSHPGDSHSFNETKDILALPLSGPWASMITALNLAIRLKPKYVLPIHDWHMNDAARDGAYDNLMAALGKENITFVKMQTGVPVVLDV